MNATNRLQEYRDRVKPRLSRSKLGRMVGLEGGSIYRIETGRQGTSLPTAQALASALSRLLDEDVRIEDLFPAPEAAVEKVTA